jgi:hypothetical protein
VRSSTKISMGLIQNPFMICTYTSSFCVDCRIGGRVRPVE